MMRFKTKTVVVCIGVLAALFSIGCNTSSPSSVDGEKSNSETIESDGTNESIAFYDEHNTDLMTWDSLPEEMRNAPQITDEDNSLKKTTYSNYLYHIGNFGGKGGHSFSIRPPAGSALYAIGIASSDKYVHRLCIWYRRNDGRIFMGLNEGTIWNGTYYIQFFDSGEYIRGVSEGLIDF